MKNFERILQQQQLFFNENKTKPISFRKSQLIQLKKVLKENINDLNKAIYEDFRKSEFETYATELSMIFHEIDMALKNLDSWSKKIRVKTDLANFPAVSYLYPEPLGTVLVIGAWNYPYQLSILPAVMALAAGNNVVIKPSELAANTSKVMAKIINSSFDPAVLFVAEGGIEETTFLLNQKFDLIFYTGSSNVGKIVMKAASQNLTPVVLELGGKSPCFVMEDAQIEMAAQRITWSKFLNGGQTCVAPDYILVKKEVREKLVEAIKKQITQQLGHDPSASEAYVNIINERHFDRLLSLIDSNKIIFGGENDRNKKYLAPTLLFPSSFSDKVMEDEIFGPLLPIIEFDNLEEVIQMVKSKPRPLALYVFTNSKKYSKKILSEISFGGGAINDTIMHLTNAHLPFGGVGNSGMGNYHGKFGFDTFTHYKSILHKTTLFEPPIKYPPYKSWKLKLIKLLMG